MISLNYQKSKQDLKEEKKERTKKKKKEKEQDKEKKIEKEIRTSKSRTLSIDLTKVVKEQLSDIKNKYPTVLYSYISTDNRILSIEKGNFVKILNNDFSKDWCKIEFEGKIGFFPMNYLYIPPQISINNFENTPKKSLQKVESSSIILEIDEKYEKGLPVTSMQENSIEIDEIVILNSVYFFIHIY